MKTERIDKLIADCTSYSRTEIKKMAKFGRISIDGQIVHDLSQKVSADSFVLIDGEPIRSEKYTYIMLNKPLGVISASEGNGDKTVVDILPEELKRKGLFPAGRLDKYSTGFVLITNDGEFAHDILSPRHHVKKTYIVGTDKELSETELEEFKKGVELSDGTVFKPANIVLIKENTYKVEIYEGKYHQIKRMFGSFGAEVLTLHRTAIGALALDESLALGEARLLNADEIELICKRDD